MSRSPLGDATRHGRFEGQLIAHLQVAQALFEAAILARERISHHGTKGDLRLHGSARQLSGDLELGAKLRILLAFGKVVSRSFFPVRWRRETTAVLAHGIAGLLPLARCWPIL
jgi:hypothetical protein